MKIMTLELLVNSLSLAFISSGDKDGGAVECATLLPAAEAEEWAAAVDEAKPEYFAMVFESSGALAPSTRSMTFPS